MQHTNSQILKAITGVLLIEKEGSPKLVCIEDLGFAKHFSIGQLFNAIRVLNNKTVEQYGTKWPKSSVGAEPSKVWLSLQEAYNSSNSDLEFLEDVCEQLGEEVPAIVEREVVLKQLEQLRHGTLLIA